jgi:hypothetical protein
MISLEQPTNFCMECEGEKFIITAKDNEYIVTPLLIGDETSHKDQEERFRIETGCEYLFTIERKENLLCEIIDEEVKPTDKELVQNIGNTITKAGYFKIPDMPII